MLKLEHANLSVTDAKAMTAFLQTAFPAFRVRGGGVDQQGRPWCHVGTDEFYVALQTVPTNAKREPYGNVTGLNHLGWEVESISELEQRMTAAGYQANLRIDDHPARHRLYFYDPDGNDWEFVQYLTDDIDQRNDYEG